QRLSPRGRPRVVSTWPHRVFGDATARRRRVDAECAAPMAALSAAGAAPDVLHCAQAPYATHVWRRAVRGRQNAQHPTPHMFGAERCADVKTQSTLRHTCVAQADFGTLKPPRDGCQSAAWAKGTLRQTCVAQSGFCFSRKN